MKPPPPQLIILWPEISNPARLPSPSALTQIVSPARRFWITYKTYHH